MYTVALHRRKDFDRGGRLWRIRVLSKITAARYDFFYLVQAMNSATYCFQWRRNLASASGKSQLASLSLPAVLLSYICSHSQSRITQHSPSRPFCCAQQSTVLGNSGAVCLTQGGTMWRWPRDCSFLDQLPLIIGNTLSEGFKQDWAGQNGEKSQISTDKSLYIGNDRKWAHSYNTRLIGNRI